MTVDEAGRAIGVSGWTSDEACAQHATAPLVVEFASGSSLHREAVDETGGAVAVGFGGVRFTGMNDGRLAFARVRDLRPEEELSPARSWTMTLDPQWVASVHRARPPGMAGA